MPEEDRDVARLAANADSDSGDGVTIVDLNAPQSRLRRSKVNDLPAVLGEGAVRRHADKIAEQTGSPLDSDASIARWSGS
jgi:hypothetical protein